MWDELGIAPCDDAKAIRRAYAARLKKLDPDRDPEAFARLRRALEWALNGAGDAPPQAHADRATEPAESILRTAVRSEPQAEHSTTSGSENPRAPALHPPAQATDHDDIRDRALLMAFDGALRRRAANEATVLYYRAAATGALSLANAPEALERLLAVAVDDMTLGAAAFRNLVRTAGLQAPQSRTPVTSEIRQRALARLAAEDWYDDLEATAQQRKGRTARRRHKIARLLLGRIGRHWHPRVDKAALRTWLAQCRTHEAWLTDRLDPAWIDTLEARLRRRDIFWNICFTLFIGGLLFQFVYVSVVAVADGPEPPWPLLIAPFAALFLLWLLKLLVTQLLTLAIPGWSGFGGRFSALRSRGKREKSKKPGDAG